MQYTKREKGVSIKDALILPALSGVVVLGGESGLDRIKRSIDIMEEPNFLPYVKEGQFLLTPLCWIILKTIATMAGINMTIINNFRPIFG